MIAEARQQRIQLAGLRVIGAEFEEPRVAGFFFSHCEGHHGKETGY
jgi:hypothetical protein